MAYLVGINVLPRKARPTDPHYPVARSAIEALVRQGDVLHISSQNIIKSPSKPEQSMV